MLNLPATKLGTTVLDRRPSSCKSMANSNYESLSKG